MEFTTIHGVCFFLAIAMFVLSAVAQVMKTDQLECERDSERHLFIFCLVLQAGPVYVQCNDGSGTGTQISEDGLQSQTQTGPGCQSQTSDDGTQSQSQSQNGYGIQTQTQCSGYNCEPLPPLFQLKPLEWQRIRPLQWNTFTPIQRWNFFQVLQQKWVLEKEDRLDCRH